MVWFRQFIPGDSHDQDEAYESILIDNRGRQSLFKMGKLGILWEIDRRTGPFLKAHDLGYQNIFEMHPDTGEIAYGTAWCRRRTSRSTTVRPSTA